jgi:hypothetical protein
MAAGQRFKIFDTLTIAASSGSIQSLATILGTTDWPTTGTETAETDRKNKVNITAIEVNDHSAAFHYGNTLLHSDKRTQAAYEPFYQEDPEGDGARLIENTFVRASADAAITGVTLTVWYR